MLTKSDHWKYEREWRCVGGDPLAQSGEQFDHWDFSPGEVSAIYLGCRMLPEHQQAILDLARDKLPHAFVFRGRRTPGMFGLTFDPA